MDCWRLGPQPSTFSKLREAQGINKMNPVLPRAEVRLWMADGNKKKREGFQLITNEVSKQAICKKYVNILPNLHLTWNTESDMSCNLVWSSAPSTTNADLKLFWATLFLRPQQEDQRSWTAQWKRSIKTLKVRLHCIVAALWSHFYCMRIKPGVYRSFPSLHWGQTRIQCWCFTLNRVLFFTTIPDPLQQWRVQSGFSISYWNHRLSPNLLSCNCLS